MDFLPTQRTATRSLLPVKSHLSTRNISIFYFRTPKSLLLYPLLYYLPLPGIALFWQCKSFSPGPPLLRYPLGPPVCALSRSSLSVPCPTLLCPRPVPLFSVRALPHSSLSTPSPAPPCHLPLHLPVTFPCTSLSPSPAPPCHLPLVDK